MAGPVTTVIGAARGAGVAGRGAAVGAAVAARGTWAGAGAPTAGAGAAAGPPAGPPGGSVGSLIVGAAEGYHGFPTEELGQIYADVKWSRAKEPSQIRLAAHSS